MMKFGPILRCHEESDRMKYASRMKYSSNMKYASRINPASN